MIRNSQREGFESSAEEDLSVVLHDIVEANNRMMILGGDSYSRGGGELLQLSMQILIDGYFDNGKGCLNHLVSSCGQIKSIVQRIKGKHGRIRGNLMGKRVEFSSRSVITGDMNVDIHEVGVPRSVCRNLSVPDVVYAGNYSWLSNIVRKGLFNRITRFCASGVKAFFRLRSGFSLRLGDEVERYISDGDIVLMNRQPSLHRLSLMSHKVRVMPFSTFRLNVSVTSPYNADFDGDEMNMHVPQTIEACVEGANLMAVHENIVSPSDGVVSIGIVQDALVGCLLMSRKISIFTF